MGSKDFILAIFELYLDFNVNVNEEQMVQFTGLSEFHSDILRQMVKFDMSPFLRCLSYDVSWFSWWVNLSNRTYQDSSWYLKILIYPLLSTFQNGETNFDCPWIHYKSEVRTAKSCRQLNLETNGSTCSLNMTAAIWSNKDLQYLFTFSNLGRGVTAPYTARLTLRP